MQALVPRLHIGMRLQYCRKTTSGLSSLDDGHRMAPTHAAINRRFQQIRAFLYIMQINSKFRQT